MASRCEDYPCCGHTPDDPCGRQWYDEPGAFDTSIPGNEHALCDHENGECDVPDDEDDEMSDEEYAALLAEEPDDYTPEELLAME
jgi:hypothetical protein